MMRNLFIIESPFQLISATEGAHYFSGDHNTLIVLFTPEENNNRQLRQLLNLSNYWNEVLTIDYPKRHLYYGIDAIKSLKRIAQNDVTPDRVFIGEYRSWLMNQFFHTLRPKDSFLLDDGNITIELQNNYLPRRLSATKFSFVSFLHAKFLQFIFGLRPQRKIDIHLFTCFDLQPYDSRQKIIKHSFSWLRSNCQFDSVDQTSIFFFGGNLSGAGLLPIDYELLLLRNVFKYYQCRGLGIIYIPHRRESDEKIRMIQNMLEIQILRIDLPAELALSRLSSLPKGISAFYSTVLFTLPKIYHFEILDSFRIPIARFPEDRRSEVEQVYLSYQGKMNIIDLA